MQDLCPKSQPYSHVSEDRPLFHYGERNAGSSSLCPSERKNKNPSAEWLFWNTRIECVGVTRVQRGEPGSEQLLRASGRNAAGVKNATQSWINSNKRFLLTVTNLAQLKTEFLCLTKEDLVILKPWEKNQWCALTLASEWNSCASLKINTLTVQRVWGLTVSHWNDRSSPA